MLLFINFKQFHSINLFLGFKSPIHTEDLESRVLIEIDEYREKLNVLVEQAYTLTSDNHSATENPLDYQVQQFTNGASERTRHFVDTCSRLLEGSLLLH